MKTETVVFIVMIIGGIFVLAIWLFEIPVISNSASVLTFVVISLLAIIFLWYIFSLRSKVRAPGFLDSFDAFQYLQERWYDARKERLKYEDTKGIPGWFEDKLFYAFRFRKGTGETGQLVVAIVQAEPKDVFWDEDPGPGEIKNPFLILNTEYKHAPIRNARPMYESIESKEPRQPQQIVYVGEQKTDEIDKFRNKDTEPK